MAAGKFAASVFIAERLVSAAGNVAAGREARALAEEEAGQIEQASQLNRELARERIKRNVATNLAEAGGLGRSTLLAIQDNIALQQYQADIDQFNSRMKASMVRRQGAMQQREFSRAAFGNVLQASAIAGSTKWDFRTQKTSGGEFGNLESRPIGGRTLITPAGR